MEQQRFILQRYKGPSTRHECPQCHDRRSFTRYIDTEGKITFPNDVGRCDHESRCGYHYTPKQYFHDNPDAKKELMEGSDWTGTQSLHQPMMQPKPEQPSEPPYYFPLVLMQKSEKCYEQNNLFLFLVKSFGKDNALTLAERYHLGTSKHWNGACVYWQIDSKGNLHEGKIMYYDKESGHRSHEFCHHPTWLHTLMKIDKERIRQCFFGEHLLSDNPDNPIAIVESEKTAIIASFYLPQYVWLASGGKDGMFLQADLSIFEGRQVTLFPDLGMLGNWRKKAAKLMAQGVNVGIYDYLEQQASEEDKTKGLDIADYLLQQEPRQFLLDKLIKKNPNIKTLMDKLDLELVQD